MSDQTLRIGQELVRRRLASLEQVRQCLQTQEELRGSGKDVPIGNLLVARGVIELEDLKEILSHLELLVLYCTGCRAELSVTDYNRKNQYNCTQCGAELIFATTRPSETSSSKPVTAPPSRQHSRDDQLVGLTVGGCTIRHKIASGGMGTVYEAEQVNLGRKIALKVLASDLAEDEVFVRRFLLEARAAAELNHINIIHINDAGQSDGIFYYTMEFVEGENLNQLLRKRKRLPVEEALDYASQVADALDHAHRKNIIHRDIKPENIMITPEGRVKLADLGLAKKVMSETHASLTQAGSILGTPFYMSPEQARDFAKVDGRSDLYSLGVTLYKMLAGKVPYDGKSPVEVIMKALDGHKKSVKEVVPDVPSEVSDIVDRIMQIDPEDRPQSAGAARDELRAILERLLVRE